VKGKIKLEMGMGAKTAIPKDFGQMHLSLLVAYAI